MHLKQTVKNRAATLVLGCSTRTSTERSTPDSRGSPFRVFPDSEWAFGGLTPHDSKHERKMYHAKSFHFLLVQQLFDKLFLNTNAIINVY